MGANASLTERLQLFMQGDAAAANDLLREVMPKLREIALRQLRLERCVAPLTKTELINELWLSSLSKEAGKFAIRDISTRWQAWLCAVSSSVWREKGLLIAGEAALRRSHWTTWDLFLEHQYGRRRGSSK